MAATDPRPTLCLTANFPLDARFAPTVGELASRLAVSAGVGEDDANAIGRSMEAAFAQASNEQSVEGTSAIDVSLCAGETTLDLSVARGASSILTLSVPRPQ